MKFYNVERIDRCLAIIASELYRLSDPKPAITKVDELRVYIHEKIEEENKKP